MNTISITQVMKLARETNNGRLNSMAMNGAEKRAAEKAEERGLMEMYNANFPGFGFVKMYQLIAK